jgi:hypothetical protein
MVLGLLDMRSDDTKEPEIPDIEPVKAKSGPKPKEFKWDVFDAIMAVGGNLSDAVEIIGLSADTIQRRVKEEKFMTVTDYRNQKMARRRIQLLNKQWETAMSGNVVMQIWLGKQLCGQSDKIADLVPETENKTVHLAYNIPGNKYLNHKPDVEVVQELDEDDE